MAFYRGIGLPDHMHTFPYLKDDLDLIRDSVLTILCTCKGQRLFDPDFGSLLCRLVFEPNDLALKVLAEETVREALMRWEPRVDLIGVFVQNNEAELKIDISMVERRLNIPFNLPLTITRERL